MYLLSPTQGLTVLLLLALHVGDVCARFPSRPNGFGGARTGRPFFHPHPITNSSTGGMTAQSSLSAKTSLSAQSSATVATTIPASTATTTTTTTNQTLNANVMNCKLTLPKNLLSAQGLSTPFLLQPPCSQSVLLQQSFAEAAVIDPATGKLSVYHPLVIDAGLTPPTPPVVPVIPQGAVVGLWFGFNGGTLELVDENGLDTNQSPELKSVTCVNGLPGVQGDFFGQVSWCNTVPFFDAANAAIAAGKLTVPPLGTDRNGKTCPSSRSFELVDACPSDNVPTQYLLLPNGTTVQDTAVNRNNYPNALIINNASDEALLANVLDPAIGCTPFVIDSLDDPGAQVPSLASDELQASAHQQAPIALVPLNDPDTLLTSNGRVSPAKTNAYRMGVDQPLLTPTGPDDGSLDFYCTGMVDIAPGFFLMNKDQLINVTSPVPTMGNNLYTFMCARYLMSLMQLGCPASITSTQPIQVATNGNGVATVCNINPTALSATFAAATTTAGTAATTPAGKVNVISEPTVSNTALRATITTSSATDLTLATKVATVQNPTTATAVVSAVVTSTLTSVVTQQVTLTVNNNAGATKFVSSQVTVTVAAPPTTVTVTAAGNASNRVTVTVTDTQAAASALATCPCFFQAAQSMGYPPPHWW